MDATTTPSPVQTEARPPSNPAHGVAHILQDRLQAVVRGRDDTVELLTIAFLANGHVLLEDFPGSGKTTLARALGESLRSENKRPFRRVQFTPDLLPSDITGASIFDAGAKDFVFRPGPVFTHVLLADEINRTSPKVQSALLEAMGERQVTVDDVTHPLAEPFLVVATQNPADFAGTYPLPSPQLDRFMFKIPMEYIQAAAEREVLDQYPVPSLDHAKEHPTVAAADVIEAQHAVRTGVHIHDAVKDALVRIARTLRADQRVLHGISTRALLQAMPALQARAVLQGRDHVLPEDLSALLPFLFTHRLDLSHTELTDASRGNDSPGVHQVLRDAMDPVLEELNRDVLR